MSLGTKIGKRFRAEFTARMIHAFSGALLVIILTRLLDPDGFGLLYFAISVLSIAELFSRLGLGKSAGRYIASYKETDPDQIKNILRFSFFLTICLITFVGVVLASTSQWISTLLDEPALVPFLLLGVLYVAFSTLNKFCRDVLQGFEAIEISSIIKIIHSVSRPIFAIGLVLLGFGAIGAFIGYIVAYFLATIFAIGYLYTKHFRLTPSKTTEPGLRRRIAEYSIPITATSTAEIIDNRIDIVLLGFFLGPAAVGFYTVCKQVLNFVQAPLQALGFTLAPSYESQRAKGNIENATKIYEQGILHSLLLYMPAVAGLILVAEPLIELMFGVDYLPAVPVLQVLGIYLAFRAITHVTSKGLDFLGRARTRAIIKMVTALLNVSLNTILIPTVGIVGAAIATVITYGMYSLGNFYIINLELDVRTGWLLRKVTANFAITLFMSSIIYFLIDHVTGLLTLIVVICLGAAIWLLLVASFGLIDIRRIGSAIT